MFMCGTINHCEIWLEQIILVLLGKWVQLQILKSKGFNSKFPFPPSLTLPESWEVWDRKKHLEVKEEKLYRSLEVQRRKANLMT
jgi:hypothetical protein